MNKTDTPFLTRARQLFRRLRAAFSAETDATFTLGTPVSAAMGSPRDLQPAERLLPLDQALEAWRTNPLARRIIELTTQYVVGSGLRVQCSHEATQRFIDRFWQHPLNRMDIRVGEWCDELSRSGNLFLLISTDPAGMSYIRAVPASEIQSIEARPNDIEQPLTFHPRPTLDDLHPAGWPAIPSADCRSRRSPGGASADMCYGMGPTASRSMTLSNCAAGSRRGTRWCDMGSLIPELSSIDGQPLRGDIPEFTVNQASWNVVGGSETALLTFLPDGRAGSLVDEAIAWLRRPVLLREDGLQTVWSGFVQRVDVISGRQALEQLLTAAAGTTPLQATPADRSAGGWFRLRAGTADQAFPITRVVWSAEGGLTLPPTV